METTNQAVLRLATRVAQFTALALQFTALALMAIYVALTIYVAILF